MLFANQKRHRLGFICATALLTQACTTLSNSEQWPNIIPAREIFIEACKGNSQSCLTEQMTENHLLWVKRFYLGSIIYPTGWLETTDLIMSTLDHGQDRQTVRQSLGDLGLSIVKEWAKNNNERIIDSQNIATWGEALRTSAERGEQIAFIETIRADVAGILSGTLNAEEITPQRYYPSGDYDNF